MPPPFDCEHPYITTAADVCGGEPVIRGARFTVRAVVAHVLRFGMTVDEVLREWPHLTAAQIHDALSCYYDHKDEIDELTRQSAGRSTGVPRPEAPPMSIGLLLDEDVPILLAVWGYGLSPDRLPSSQP